jgi:excisionase family DNA binding protein
MTTRRAGDIKGHVRIEGRPVTRDDLLAAVEAADTQALPVIIGDLESAKAAAYARLATPVLPREPTKDRLLTMPEVAEQLGVNVHQAREMGRRGELPVTQVGERFVRVRSGALTDWIRQREGATLSRPGRR